MPALIIGDVILTGDRVRLGDVEGVVCSLIGQKANGDRDYQLLLDDGSKKTVMDKPERVGATRTYAAKLVCEPLETDISKWPTSKVLHAFMSLVADHGGSHAPASWRKATKDERNAFWTLLKDAINIRVPIPEFDNTTRPSKDSE